MVLTWLFVFLPALVSAPGPAVSATLGQAVSARMDSDALSGKPLVAQVVVALCDNEHQGIVPVSPKLGNGQDPNNNLYWGARYGVRHHLATPAAGWRRVTQAGPLPRRVLERVVFRKRVVRSGKKVWAYLVAEAWDGRAIREATARFLKMAAGQEVESLDLGSGIGKISAGGGAHLIVYVGHDGLMDFEAPVKPVAKPGTPARSVAVLACASKDYFSDVLARAGAHRLVLTTGLMAPEAYVLDALVSAWFSGRRPQEVQSACGAAYHKFQKCDRGAARRLFSGHD